MTRRLDGTLQLGHCVYADPNDTINIHNNGALTLGGAVFATDGSGPVAGTTATEALHYATGTSVNASTVPNNFIDITSPVNTVPGTTTASSGFALAMGGILRISQWGPSHPYLMSYYDVQDAEAVLEALVWRVALSTAAKPEASTWSASST